MGTSKGTKLDWGILGGRVKFVLGGKEGGAVDAKKGKDGY